MVSGLTARQAEILSLMRSDPDLRAPLCEAHPETRAEVAYGIDREFVLLPSDYLERRTPLRYSPGGCLEAYDAVAEIVTARLPFAEDAIAEDRERYFADRERERQVAEEVHGRP